MIAAICSAKGAPGVSTTAAALALRWDRLVSLIELDPFGGSYVPWWSATRSVSYEPGLISLAASRNDINSDALVLHSQRVGTFVQIVGAPANGRQTRTAAASVLARLDPVALAGCDVLVDAGRVEVGTPSARVLEIADRVIVVTRPDLASIAASEQLIAAAAERTDVQVLAIGHDPYRAADLAEHFGVAVTEVADDRRGATQLQLDPEHRAVHRSALSRSLATVVTAMTRRTPAQGVPAQLVTEVGAA